jgi:AraC-like DNA-binding protein
MTNVSVSCVRYGDDMRITTGELASFVVVQVPLSGHALVNCGPRQILAAPGLASVSCLTEPLSMWWSADCAKLIVRIERQALEAELSDLLNRPVDQPVRFDLGMDLISAPTYTWHSTARLLVADLDRGDGLTNQPLVAARFEHLLIAGLLLAQPNNYTSMLSARQRPAGSRAIKEAVALIESHPERPLTVASIARAVAVSVRSLQEGFRRYVGCSPTQYLREVRLHRARRELLAAEPGAVTVTDVAYRWGFTHVGRFSAVYRRRYGESPSMTLRR